MSLQTSRRRYPIWSDFKVVSGVKVSIPKTGRSILQFFFPGRRPATDPGCEEKKQKILFLTFGLKNCIKY
ncbi:hypothetical protein [Methanosarcina siciliae]|uniref:hypothetical protein n=1 Tax=Methanosarcina siciliae TaxID=38027 RepID=UPI00064FCEDD|nr:hypothetical protein [Methanosarcina siciliae]